MVRVNKIRRSDVTAKRQQDNKKRMSIKAGNKRRRKRKTKTFRQHAKKMKNNKNKQQEVETRFPITPRKSARLAMKRQKNENCTEIVPHLSAQAANDPIVIEDTDEENETNISNLQANASVCFYEDRNPGLRDMEVPLYKMHSMTVATDCPVTVYDTSIIELDNTIDNTQANSSISLFNAHPQSSSSKKSLNDAMEDVIDLSDDTDNVTVASVSATVQSIPLGYKIVKPHHHNNKAPKKQQISGVKSKKSTTSISPLSSSSSSTAPDQHPNGNTTEPRTKRMIIIDGNNVAYSHLNGKMFSVKGLDLCIQYFKKLGHEVVAVVPQYKLKRTQSTDQELLHKLHRQGDVILAPSKNLPGLYSSPYDDRLIISVAEKFDGVIISNDNFRDLLDANPVWRRIIETRVIGYTWVKDCFFLPDDPYGRQGPSSLAILNGYSL